MSRTDLRRKMRASGCAAALLAGLAAASPARAADNLWDTVLEKMNVKAAPADRAPEFVEQTRPDAAGLGYLPTAVPHKVSPLPVKSADQIQAAKDALDTAKARQLAPGAPKVITPVAGKVPGPGAAKVARRGKGRKPVAAPATAAAD